jgi:diadenosine tetraphosphate (Ap4A) HIT family hydrolase
MRRVEKETALELVRASLHGLAENACAMCALAKGQINAELQVLETDTARVVLDRFASLPGHLLVVLKRHQERVTDLPTEEYLQFQSAVHAAAQVLERALQPKRIFIAMLGASTDVGISMPHVHAHVIPVHVEDESTRPGKVFSWSNGLYVYDPGEGEALAERLRRSVS